MRKDAPVSACHLHCLLPSRMLTSRRLYDPVTHTGSAAIHFACPRGLFVLQCHLCHVSYEIDYSYMTRPSLPLQSLHCHHTSADPSCNSVKPNNPKVSIIMPETSRTVPTASLQPTITYLTSIPHHQLPYPLPLSSPRRAHSYIRPHGA
jgi:hypothetical protein